VGGKKEVATGDVRLCGAILDVDHLTGKALSLTRVQKKLA
jgi:calcineurin-like phosphoesterase